MRFAHEEQHKYSDSLEKNENGEFKLTPRKVMWITPETVDECLFLRQMHEAIKSEHIGITKEGGLIISVKNK